MFRALNSVKMRKVTRKYTFEKNQFPFNSYRRHSHNYDLIIYTVLN